MAFTALCLMVLTAYCGGEDVLSGRFTSPSALDTPHVATIHRPPHVTPDTADFFS
jgi:hypothetical protein